MAVLLVLVFVAVGLVMRSSSLASLVWMALGALGQALLLGLVVRRFSASWTGAAS